MNVRLPTPSIPACASVAVRKYQAVIDLGRNAMLIGGKAIPLWRGTRRSVARYGFRKAILFVEGDEKKRR